MKKIIASFMTMCMFLSCNGMALAADVDPFATPIHPIRAVCGTASRHELPLESTERAHFSAESNPALAKNLLSRAQNCVWGI